MNIGKLKHLVTLESVPDSSDEVLEPRVFDPPIVPCAIRPSPPSAYDEMKVTHVVEMRHHKQVTCNTRLTFTDGDGRVHHLYVRGIQPVDMAGRELVLLCEETLTP